MWKFLFVTLAMVFMPLASVYAFEDEATTLSFGPMVIGEERIPIDLDDFKLKVATGKLKVKAKWVKGSVQWVRVRNSLLLPRARIAIEAVADSKELHVRYQENTLLMQKVNVGGKDIARLEIYVSLFYPEPIPITFKGKKAGQITIQAQVRKSETSRNLIDYSCAPYSLDFKGLEDDFISVGCQLIRVGEIGKERPLLEVYWSCANCRLEDNTAPPYTAILTNNTSVSKTIRNSRGRNTTVTISAKLPKRLNRFRTAIGFGPYGFRSVESPSLQQRNIAPAAMLYANFYLTNIVSLRMFDAIVYNKSLFNNFGFYMGYELGRVLDNRLNIVALLGVQAVTFKYYHPEAPSYSQVIFPQGFEIAYKHAFGMKNYTLGYGMFVSASEVTPYQNVWIRFGKSIFGELNYISWERGERKASMLGLTIAMPFFSML